MRAMVVLTLALPLYAVAGEKAKPSLPLAAAAEAEGKFDRALDIYLKCYLNGERTEGVREKIHDCLRLTSQARRHRDAGFRSYVRDLNASDALALYAEILETLGRTYADKERAKPEKLFGLSVQEIDRALADPAFRKAFITGPAEAVEKFRRGLGAWAARAPATIKESRAALVELIRAAQADLVVEASPLVLEAICGACAGLDESTVYLSPPQVKTALAEPSIDRAEIVDSMHGVAVIRISRFRDGTPAEFDAAVQRLRMEGMRSLVLDLRGNPGGSFLASLAVAERLVPGGILATTLGQAPEFADRVFSAGGMSALDLPLAVLVDGKTMSAAEVLASAVKENNRGTLVGLPTFGKGTVQSGVPVAEGTLVVTIAKVLTGRGTPLNAGVVPHIEERDPELQMRAALEQVRE